MGNLRLNQWDSSFWVELDIWHSERLNLWTLKLPFSPDFCLKISMHLWSSLRCSFLCVWFQMWASFAVANRAHQKSLLKAAVGAKEATFVTTGTPTQTSSQRREFFYLWFDEPCSSTRQTLTDENLPHEIGRRIWRRQERKKERDLIFVLVVQQKHNLISHSPLPNAIQ